jgi:hypothetical protein
LQEIQRLIAPPSEEYKKKPPNPFKRAGKSNHDTCDSCSEAGNLICCDYCTASFHLSCHDPPLEEEDIPAGLWLCHTCTMKEKYAKVVNDENVVDPDEAPTSTTNEVEQEHEQPMEIVETVVKTEDEEGQQPEPEQQPVELSPFEELVRAASLLNPRQFELPVEMRESFPFPGSERVEPLRNGRRVKSKRLVELDTHGCVPIPAKTCFTCSRSCKRAPLISCDYCSLYFHQDCLDPPMCALPSGRWMCPNHPQHFIDWNLVTSLSATERMKLWDQHAKDPIDHEVVKLQFFRKVHMRNPPFRTKLRPKRIDEVEVPDVVRYQYENPPALLPSLRQVMRVDALKKRGTVGFEQQRVQIDEIDSQLEAIGEARRKLRGIFSDQEDVHGLMEEEEVEEERQVDEKSPSKSPKRSRRSKHDGDLDVKVEIGEIPVVQGDAAVDVKIEVDEGKKVSILTTSELSSINEQLENLDEDTLKLLAFQRLQQIVNENPNHIQKFQDKSAASSLIGEIAKWDTNRFPIPQKSDEEKPVVVRMRDRPFHIRNDAEKASSLALSLEYPIHKSKVKARAVMTFANDYLSGRIWFTVTPSLNQSVFMRYRSFDIGIGGDNHLDLARFGACAYASSKHATVFYDEVTKQFELLNYSEFGTEVNGQIYACDFSEHQADVCESPASPMKDKRVAIQSKIKNMLDAKKKIREGVDQKSGGDGGDVV